MSTDTASLESTTGILEMHPDGYGFLRNITQYYEARPGDAYVPADVIRRFDLREGLTIAGNVQAPGPESFVPDRGGRNGYQNNNRRGMGRNQQRGNFRNQQRGAAPPRKQGPRLSAVTEIEGADPEIYKGKPNFDRLTPIDPNQWLKLETVSDRYTTRVIDMFTPIGKGQRGLIVAPPRTGKTILMQHLAEGIAANHPEVELIVLLVDERPEEVTEMRRSIPGTVYASSNDRETQSHVRLAQMVIERSKRLVEMGRDVVVLLDSITRLARAYNKQVGTTGRTMSGGLDVKALDIPKKLFGSARACDEGGSLTVMGTALIETGSRMDDVIFQEFKGTGNMELVLDRRLSDRRVYPAIDIPQSGTRKEERLLPPEMLERITLLRRTLIQMNPVETMESLLAQLRKHKTNADFLDSIGKFVR